MRDRTAGGSGPSASPQYADGMTAGPAFVRFTSPFWFGLQGYFAQQDGTVVETDLHGRQILVAVGEVDDDEPFVGVVRPGSVLPVYAYDERFQTVSVWLPEPWLQDEIGLPLHDASRLVPADEQDAPPVIEVLTRAQAVDLFPGDFDVLTQDDLDRWAAEDAAAEN